MPAVFLSPAERIIRELVRRLESATLFSDGKPTAVEVVRPNRDASNWSPKDNTVLVMQGESARLPGMDLPGNPPAVAYALTLTLAGFARQSDRSTLPDDSESNELAGVIQRAVTGGDADWHTFGGVALDARFGDVATFPRTSDSHSGATVELTVHYRVSELDPFEVRS